MKALIVLLTLAACAVGFEVRAQAQVRPRSTA